MRVKNPGARTGPPACWFARPANPNSCSCLRSPAKNRAKAGFLTHCRKTSASGVVLNHQLGSCWMSTILQLNPNCMISIHWNRWASCLPLISKRSASRRLPLPGKMQCGPSNGTEKASPASVVGRTMTTRMQGNNARTRCGDYSSLWKSIFRLSITLALVMLLSGCANPFVEQEGTS